MSSSDQANTSVDAPDVRLIIIMRNDRDDMNAGKACAQAAHAANQCVAEGVGHWREQTREDLKLWQNQTTGGFGTTVVLSASPEEMCSILDKAKGHVHAGVVFDPTYPVVIPFRPWEEMESKPMRHVSKVLNSMLLGLALFTVIFLPSLSAIGVGLALAWFMSLMAPTLRDLVNEKIFKESLKEPTVELHTCMYLFGRKEQLAPFVKGLPLKV